MPEPDYSSGSQIRRKPVLKVLAIAATIVLILCAIASAILVFRWPFRERDVIESLEERVGGTVVAREFHGSFFPHAGCVLRGVTVTRRGAGPGDPPFATAAKLTVEADYPDLFLHPGYIRLIFVDDLAVQILPRKSKESATDLSSNGQRSEMRAGSIVVQNAKLRIGRRDGKKPLDFAIHSLVLGSVASDQEITYSVEMTNPLPPGELSAHGRFGPWNHQNFKETPLSGSSVLERANLDVFPSVSGSLSSENEFSGVLERIGISGWTDIPDFHVKSASHTEHVHAPFRAVVNGTDGNVELTQVKAQIEKTTVDVQGSIAGHTGRPGKVTKLDFSVEDGAIEDVLNLFVRGPQPPLRGVTNLEGHAILRGFGGSFLQKTSLDGTFEIKEARFSGRRTQQNVDSLSARSLGESQKADAPVEVRSNFRGRLNMTEGKARFSDLSMSVPGALASMNGTYNLTNDRIDFHGTLSTHTEISKTTSGIKSILLKPLDPLFKKKNAGAVIPVEMVGTYNQPHFGIEPLAKGQHGNSGNH